MTGFVIELRRTPARWAALLLLPACLALVFLVGDGQGSWPEASASATKAGLPLAVVAVGLAAHRTSMTRRSGPDALPRSRPLPVVALTRLMADATWLCGTYLMCTLAVWGAAIDEPGGPWLEYPLFGVLGIVFAVALGQLLGTFVSLPFTGAVGSVGAFLLFLFVFESQSSPLSALTFYQSIDVRLSPQHLVWRLVITLLAVGAAVTAGTVDAMSRHRSPLLVPAPSSAVFGVAVVAALLAGPGGPDEPLMRSRVPESPVCAGFGGSAVCVWPEHQDHLAAARSAAAAVAAAAKSVLQPPSRYQERGLSRSDGRDGFTLDHGAAETERSMVTEMLNLRSQWCAEGREELNEAKTGATVRLDAWLTARLAKSDKIAPGSYFGDTGWQDEVAKVLKLSEPEQIIRARSWAETVKSPC